MNDINVIKEELETAQKVLASAIYNNELLKQINQASELLCEAFKNGNKVISCGNGGSMCDAIHFAEELTGRYRKNRKAFPAIAVSDSGHLSCVANDFGYDQVFVRFLEGLGVAGDILFAISSSGNSANILRAAEFARKRSIKIISLTGNDGGELAGISDININIPFVGYADRIQEMHIKIIHILMHLIELKTDAYSAN